jgi:hypothetical protein
VAKFAGADNRTRPHPDTAITGVDAKAPRISTLHGVVLSENAFAREKSCATAAVAARGKTL